MTVKSLIKRLSRIENKDLEVFLCLTNSDPKEEDIKSCSYIAEYKKIRYLKSYPNNTIFLSGEFDVKK